MVGTSGAQKSLQEETSGQGWEKVKQIIAARKPPRKTEKTKTVAAIITRSKSVKEGRET
jgi:hypothetical protein